MPRIIDYTVALEQLQTHGLVSVYPNGGALGFARGVQTRSIGWIGPEDPTIRAEAMAYVRRVAAPFESNLSSLVVRGWGLATGRAWVMPASHWSFELGHGSGDWLPDALLEIGVSPEISGASPIEFAPAEAEALRLFVQRLLQHLRGSDFTLAFPLRAVFALVHHHKQIWWTSTDAGLIESIGRLVDPITASGPS